MKIKKIKVWGWGLKEAWALLRPEPFFKISEMGILTYSKPPESFANVCFLGFHQNCFFCFWFLSNFKLFKEKGLEMIPNPKKISMTHGIFSIIKTIQKDPKKLNDSKVFEYPTTYRIICSFLFTSVSLKIFLATLNLAKTNAWKWFLAPMRSHQPMESFRASHLIIPWVSGHTQKPPGSFTNV